MYIIRVMLQLLPRDLLDRYISVAKVLCTAHIADFGYLSPPGKWKYGRQAPDVARIEQQQQEIYSKQEPAD